jgi:molybdate transport system ATP-binding protein
LNFISKTVIDLSVRKNLGDFSLNLSLTLDKGMTVLFGPSGSGKSLTLQTIAGWVVPEEGFVQVNGSTYFDKKKKINVPIHERRIGYVFQEPSLFPHMTVWENIAFGISRLSSREKENKVRPMMERMRLEGLEKHYPHQLSGGQKQRVAVARSLVTSPLVLLLDEPFASLDQPVRTKIRLDLIRIQKEDKVPILFVTHDVEEAFILADEIVVINDGRAEQVGSKEEVFYRPKTHKVAKYFGAKNIFQGKVIEVFKHEGRMKVEVAQKGFQAVVPFREGTRTGDRVQFCIRPEEIMILKGDRSIKDSLKDNIFSGVIVDIVERGSDHTLFLKQSQDNYDLEISIPNPVYRNFSLSEGKRVNVAFKWKSIWLIPD